MTHSFHLIWCAIGIVAVLGRPTPSQAQTITDSIARLSDADIHQALNRATSANPGQWALSRSERVREGAKRGAIVGLIAGFIAGLKINSACRDEGGACREVVIALSGLGAGIGAGIGAVRAAGP
jgi:hypothetical protein